MSAARAVYSAVVYAMLPFALTRIAWRSRREAGYRAHVSERFGHYRTERSTDPLIWLHAVSVGETGARSRLCALLKRVIPNIASSLRT